MSALEKELDMKLVSLSYKYHIFETCENKKRVTTLLGAEEKLTVWQL